MKILNPEKDPEVFFSGLSGSRQRVLLLDYDGTLAPFQIDRDKAFPYPGVRDVLEEIMAHSRTRLIIISGRRVKDLQHLLGLRTMPELWGSHGGERRLPDGTYQKVPLDKDAARALESVARSMKNRGWEESVERKPLGLALHWRGMEPDRRRQMRAEVQRFFSKGVDPRGLAWYAFDGGIELRPADTDKGGAVRAILEETERDAAAAYLGDDHTDEDAFEAIGGRGLGVLVREEFRETRADLWIQPPDELLAFLRRWASAGPIAAKEK